MKKKMAIFASGSGSNAENMIRYFASSKVLNFPVILSNKPDAFIHERAKTLNIPSLTFSKQDFESGEKILEVLDTYQIDAIVLAGFLLKVPAIILKSYPGKIINIHPALLPRHGGKECTGNGYTKR